MRRALALVLAACGGTAPAVTTPVAQGSAAAAAVAKPRVKDRAPVDTLAALAPVDDDGDVSYLVPGRVLLELGSTPIEGPGGNRPIEVGFIEDEGKSVRVAVRLDHARFALWADRNWLLGVVTSEQRVSTYPGSSPMSDMHVALRAGARVRRLAHKNGSTQVRFVGAIEVDGWIPDTAIADAAPRHQSYRIPTGRKTLMVLPGAAIRAEPRWGTGELGVVANGYLVDIVKEVDDAWAEVAYADGEVSVHGYLDRHAPPNRVHRTKDPDVEPVQSTPNTRVASGTCLFSRVSGDRIGYIVGDRDVQLDDLGNGWWTLSVDSPWGAIAFATQGPTSSALVACAPAGSVPPPAPPPAPVQPTP